jgi:hypothetical protein
MGNGGPDVVGDQAGVKLVIFTGRIPQYAFVKGQALFPEAAHKCIPDFL